MAANVNTIVLKEKGHHDEAPAGTATIAPGMAIEAMADGNVDPVAATAAEYAKTGLKIATEDALQGKTIKVTDLYALGATVFFYSCLPGDHVHALVKAAEDIAIGDKLIAEGGGSGFFVEAAGTEEKYQLEALEADAAVAAGGVHLKCRVVNP